MEKRAVDGFATVRLKEEPKELVVHLPTIHDFLVFHAFFGDEDVDDLWIGEGTVRFEPLANDVANVSR